MDPTYLKLALGGLALMGSIGLFFGIGLALAAHKFAVEVNPKVEKANEALPGANCGACSFPGCEAFAEAVVLDPNVAPNLCTPGGDEVAEEIAEITGKETEKIEGAVAVIHCAVNERYESQKAEYTGYKDCEAAALAFGGPIDCHYGCIGYGDCMKACPFNAINVINYFPVVDSEACVACGLCVSACPKNLISLVPKKAKVYVKCWCKDTSAVTMSTCSLGCIHCMECIERCPADAISLEDGYIKIDHDVCLGYEADEEKEPCGEACISACWIAYPADGELGKQILTEGKQYFQRPIVRNPFHEPLEKTANEEEDAQTT